PALTSVWPRPARVPPVQVNTSLRVREPREVRVPPDRVKVLSRVESPDTVREAPVKARSFSLMRLWIESLAWEWVRVMGPETLMTTASVGPGTCRVVQWAGVAQLPEPATQRTTAGDVRPSRVSSRGRRPAAAGRLAGRRPRRAGRRCRGRRRRREDGS